MILAALWGCGDPAPTETVPTPVCTHEPCVRDLATASFASPPPSGTLGYSLAATATHVVVGVPDDYAVGVYPRVTSLALPSLSLEGSWIGRAQDRTGAAVAAADVDGDGLEEVAFGSPAADRDSAAIHLVDPRTTGDCDLETGAPACTLLTIVGAPDNGDGGMGIGWSLAFARDNRELWFEGYRGQVTDDRAIYAYDTSDRGTVGVEQARRVITGVAIGPVDAWDANGDGIDDLVAWDGGNVAWFEGPWHSGTMDDRDGVWTSPCDVELENCGFGQVIDDVGDVTGDGIADLAVAAPQLDAGTGAVYVVPGASPTPAFGPADDLPIVVAGTAPEMGTGYALTAGDLDGDGEQDLVVSASGVWGWSDPGVVLVYRGPLAPGDRTTDDADARVYGERAFDLFARALDTVDADGDGRDDLVAGAPAAEGVGAVYLIPGSALFP